MSNFAYPGSIAEFNMNFTSSVDVVVNESTELFNAISIYIPMSQAVGNILGFDPSWVTAEKPAVITCNSENYTRYMTGRLLDQWGDVFGPSTSFFDITLYLIVFLDGEGTEGMWDIDDVSIRYKPITEAFSKLYFISYFKTLFDENYRGLPALIPAVDGTFATASLNFTNSHTSDVVITLGTYTFSDGSREWSFTIDSDVTLAPTETFSTIAVATTVGVNSSLTTSTVITIPNFATGLDIAAVPATQGTEPTPEMEVPSRYFDYSLALALMSRQDQKLSYYVGMVRITYVNDAPNPDDICWVRYATVQQEMENMTSIAGDDRSRYYWGALRLMNCVQNTWTLIHSEPVNIFPLVLAAWFRERNASGQYVGNKLSLLRLRGIRIKPNGFPSWLNGEINANDRDGIGVLQAKNVGFLRTIADNTPQESVVDSARSINGTPVGAQMISKWVDYTCAQQTAKFITDDGTLVDPVLTNEAAYGRIQDIVHSNLLLFTGMRRISGITLRFPLFSVAKVGPRELRAARAWQAIYSDDLDTVTVTGGILA